MNKKKLFVIIAIIILVLILIFTVYFLILKKEDTSEESKRNEKVTMVTGKLKETIERLGNNYAIKYSGNFLNDKKEKVNAIIEYTKSNGSYAIKSNELGLYMVCENNEVKSISTQYKLIFIMPRSAVDISMYNIVGNYAQTFNKSYKENVKDKEYFVEEYTLNDVIVKYYFLNDEIKFIKYNDEKINIIRIENTYNKDLFNIPSNYNVIGE